MYAPHKIGIFGFLLLAGSNVSGAADQYVCVSPTGKKSIQDVKCADGNRTEVVLQSHRVAADRPYLGVFSNKADGFDTKTLVLHDNGKGLYFAGTGAISVNWRYDARTNRIVLLVTDDPHKGTSFELGFDLGKRTLTILDNKLREGSKPLRFITDEIPGRYAESLR
jgi:hypothetical protein